MGVEYRHFLVVDDAHWRPLNDTVARVEAVLREWRLVDKIEQIVDLAPGADRCLRSEKSCQTPGPGVEISYAGVDGAMVDVLAGPSHYPDISASERYLKSTTLIVGEDYRVQWSTDGIWFEVVAPPLSAGKAVVAQEDTSYTVMYSASFSSDKVDVPPTIRAHVQEYAKAQITWTDCLGYWRGGLVLDFGKDLPAFAEGVQALPSRAFVTALSDAFRGRLIEIGDFY